MNEPPKLPRALSYGVLLAGLLAASGAQAIPILTFGQVGNGTTVTGTQSGSTTTITATNAAILISQIDSAANVPISAFLTLSLTSTSAAIAIQSDVLQDYSGTFVITSAPNGGGIDYLTGSLIDVAFGQNAAFTLTASTPPANTVTFTSSVITDLGLDRAASFSFADVTPGLSITDGTIASFQSSLSATFSAQPVSVPEPTAFALLGTGLLALGMIRRRR